MNPMPKFPKWVTPPLHPVNDAPMLSPAELKALAADIKRHGLQEPIVIWRDNRDAANGSKGPFPQFLLDGKNRAKALAMLGITDPNHAPSGKLVINRGVRYVDAIKMTTSLGGGQSVTEWVIDTDPYALHLSLNYHRRQLSQAEQRKMLTSTQKRWEIKKVIIKHPQWNDNEIAKKFSASHNTVASVRSEMGGENCQFDKNPHKPVERAVDAIKKNPKASNRQLAKKANVDHKTIAKARKESATYRKAEKPDPKQSLDRKPISKERKQREMDQAIDELIAVCFDFAKKTETDPATLVTLFECAGKVKCSVLAKELSKRIAGGNKNG